MRLLAVRGRNLASLAEPFAVDFATGPLADAGLFAITGETGAGKSTLLDAICLALYGAFPRLAAGDAQESIADTSGELTRADRPQSILRRGASEGFAEVDFTGLDGGDWRVRWAIRRARGKASGRLQKAEHTLMTVGAGEAQAALSGTEPVKARIEELTGLTFGQFCRTALLAQGEFDAFLRADVRERAGLLETITGTDLYRVLSKRVYEADAAATAAIRTLEVQRDAIGLMEDEARAALDAERQHLSDEARTDDAARAVLEAALARHHAVQDARAALEAAETGLLAEQAAVAALAGDADRLAALDAAEAFRAPFAAVAAAGEDQKAADARLHEAQATFETRRAASETAEAAGALTASALESLRADHDRLLVFWDEAASLDGAIATAATEAATAAADHARLRQEAEAVALKAGTVAADTGAREADLQAAGERRVALAGLEETAARTGDLAALIASRAQARREQASAEARATAARRCHDAAEAAIAATGLRRQQEDDALAELTPRIQAMQAQLAGLDAASLLAAAEALAMAERDLGAARDAAGRRAQADADAGAAAQAVEFARAARLEAAGRQQAAEAAQQQAGGVVRAAAQALQLAEGTASDAAVRLRARLHPGEPCPVCGALDHPGHETEALTGLVAALKQQHGEAEATLAATSARLRTADAESSAAEATLAHRIAALESARGTREQAIRHHETALEAAAQALASACRQVPDTSSLKRFHDTENVFRSSDTQDLTAALSAVADARTETAGQLETLQDLRRRLDALGTRRDALLSARAESQQTLSDHAQNRAQAAQEMALARSEAENAARRAGEAASALSQPLARLAAAGWLAQAQPAGREIADEHEDKTAIAALRRLEHEAADVTRQEQAARSALEVLRPALSAARAAAAAQSEAAEAAAARAAGREGTLSTLRHQRAGLLGGEATASHRAAFTARLRAAEEDDRQARAACGEASRQMTAALAGCSHAGERQREALAARSHAETALAAALLSAGQRHDDVATRLAEPPDIRTALRDRLQRASESQRRAEAAMLAFRERLERLTAGEPAAEGLAATGDIAALEADRDRLNAAGTTRQQRLGAIAQQMRQDDEARRRASGLAGEIAQARDKAAVWSAVNAAVGSASGDKFQRFAQGLTLDSLIHLANRHLSQLKPRYRLARAPSELGLQVEDREMAGEVRSTRSLSGGERFLVSLALALALSSLEGRQSFVDMLFIDEGFGSLDADSLDIAIDALETLQAQGRKVGVVSHVQAMKDRIPVQVRVERQGADRSRIVIAAPDAG